MAASSFLESIGDIVAFITGTSVGIADAANSAQQAVTSQTTFDKVTATAVAANDLLSVTTGGMQQILQRFSPTSTEAARLLGKAGASSSFVGLELASIPIYTALINGKPGSITTGQLDALSGSALLVGAIFLPEVATMLTVVGSLMVAAAVFDNNSNNTLSNAVTKLKSLIQPYYNQLSAANQAAFTNEMSGAMASTFSGGMLVPKVNDAGWVVGYVAGQPTSTSRNGSSTTYTFASGVTYVIGQVTDGDPLTDSTTGTAKSIWTVPGTGANNAFTLDIHSGGTYSNRFTDPEGNAVTEIYIAGSSGTYDVAATDGDYQFIYVSGPDNRVVIHGDNNQVSLADDNRVSIDGGNNVVHAYANSTIEFGSGDRNKIYNEITGGTLTVFDGVISVTDVLNGNCGGGEVVLGVTNRLKINADGSKTITLQYENDDRFFHRIYDATGVQTETLSISPDGSYGDFRYDLVTGLTTRLTTASSNGAGMVLTFGAAQQLVEQVYFQADGSETRYLNSLTGQNTVFSGGKLPSVHYDPVTDTVTWIPHDFASTSTTATAPAEIERHAAQLVQAIAAYPPEL
jgi:hypothetical protein